MYFKITNREEKHNGMQYQTGLNVDILPFNDNPKASCVPGGIYFSDEKNICGFLTYGQWIREVTLPEDAKVVKDPSGGKWRANKVLLGERRDLRDPNTFKWLDEICKVDLAEYLYNLPKTIREDLFENYYD